MQDRYSQSHFVTEDDNDSSIQSPYEYDTENYSYTPQYLPNFTYNPEYFSPPYYQPSIMEYTPVFPSYMYNIQNPLFTNQFFSIPVMPCSIYPQFYATSLIPMPMPLLMPQQEPTWYNTHIAYDINDISQPTSKSNTFSSIPQNRHKEDDKYNDIINFIIDKRVQSNIRSQKVLLQRDLRFHTKLNAIAKTIINKNRNNINLIYQESCNGKNLSLANRSLQMTRINYHKKMHLNCWIIIACAYPDIIELANKLQLSRSSVTCILSLAGLSVEDLSYPEKLEIKGKDKILQENGLINYDLLQTSISKFYIKNGFNPADNIDKIIEAFATIPSLKNITKALQVEDHIFTCDHYKTIRINLKKYYKQECETLEVDVTKDLDFYNLQKICINLYQSPKFQARKSQISTYINRSIADKDNQNKINMYPQRFFNTKRDLQTHPIADASSPIQKLCEHKPTHDALINISQVP